ncbi:MAG: hypothetical protein WA876_10005 [Candidatus Acidiferrales bacterium]
MRVLLAVYADLSNLASQKTDSIGADSLQKIGTNLSTAQEAIDFIGEMLEARVGIEPKRMMKTRKLFIRQKVTNSKNT